MTYSSVFGKLAASALSMCILTSGATATLTLLTEPAWANNGNSNANGRESANRSSTRANDRSNAQSGNAGNSGNNANKPENASNRGGNSSNNMRAISKELARFDASLATPSALASAAPGTVSGQLKDYRDTFRRLVSTVEKQNVAYSEFERLSQMPASQIARIYPNGGHGLALADATAVYSALRHDAATAQAQNQAVLQRLTGGQALSNAAMEDLHILLGL